MSVKPKFHSLWPIQIVSDALAIAAAYYTTVLVRFHSEWGARLFTAVNRHLRVRETGWLGDELERFYVESAPRILVILGLTIGVLYALRDLYPDRRFLRKRHEAWNVIVANASALILFYAYFYLSRNVFHPRSMFLTILSLNVVYTVAFRSAAERLLQLLREKAGVDRCHAILIGAGDEARLIDGLIEAVHPHGINVQRRLQVESGEPFERFLSRLAVAARECGANMIIAADLSFTVAQIMQLLEAVEQLDLPVKVLSEKFDVIVNQARIPSDLIRGIPLLHFEPPRESRRLASLRHAGSRLLALLLLIALAPLMATIAALIKLTCKGPAFFVQERIGINLKPFPMFKFRTMHDRSQEAIASLEEFNESGDGLFKIRKDPRVTPIGRVLRRFSLDELPQLINVLRGEMTLVGPRPLPRRDFEHYYEQWHYTRHGGLPGLTCLWQVSGRSDIDFHNMCILDLFYLRNQNWVLDLKILFRTIWVVAFARGAY